MNWKEALIAHLQGNNVQKRNEWSDEWRPLIQGSEAATLLQILDPKFGSACEFRIAPRTIIVNGVEVPAPESVAPERGTAYFAPSVLWDDFYDSLTWIGGDLDKRLFERGLVYLRKKDAIARAKAILLTQSN